MSMPYHKELLRSSVSLCFREFFVFRNKAKGVMTLLCQFEKMIYPSGTGAADAASFMIALYRPCEKLKDSSGNTITQIKAVGYCLPTAGNMRYEMRGHWRKDPKYGIQYDVEGYEEQIIPTREGIIAYLSSGQIKGIGPKMAERIYDAFGNMALEVLDKKPEKLLTISGISQNKLKKICDSYLANRGARDVVAFASSSSTVGVLLMIPSIMFPFCSVVCSAVFKGLSRCACSAATANARVPFPIIRYFPSSDWW